MCCGVAHGWKGIRGPCAGRRRVECTAGRGGLSRAARSAAPWLVTARRSVEAVKLVDAEILKDVPGGGFEKRDVLIDRGQTEPE